MRTQISSFILGVDKHNVFFSSFYSNLRYNIIMLTKGIIQQKSYKKKMSLHKNWRSFLRQLSRVKWFTLTFF